MSFAINKALPLSAEFRSYQTVWLNKSHISQCFSGNRRKWDRNEERPGTSCREWCTA